MSIHQYQIDIIDRIKEMKVSSLYFPCQGGGTVTGRFSSSVDHITEAQRPQPGQRMIVDPQCAVQRGVTTLKDQRPVPRHKRSHVLRMQIQAPFHLVFKFKGISWRRAKLKINNHILEYQT